MKFIIFLFLIRMSTISQKMSDCAFIIKFVVYSKGVKMKNTVFVYGTLRKKLKWHHLLKTGLFIGNAITKEKYTLYADNIPYLIETESSVQIIGEVYEIDDITLNVLDRLEGHPDWYYRKEVQVVLDGKQITAWIYFFPKATGRLIASGDFTKAN